MLPQVVIRLPEQEVGSCAGTMLALGSLSSTPMYPLACMVLPENPGCWGAGGGQGRRVSSRPWFNLARQQPQPLQQFAAAARVSLDVGALTSSPTPSPTTLPSIPRVPADSAAHATLGRRHGPADTAGGAGALGPGLGSGPGSTEPRRVRVRVRLAHAELASCADGPAWDGGTCLALSGEHSGCAKRHWVLIGTPRICMYREDLIHICHMPLRFYP